MKARYQLSILLFGILLFILTSCTSKRFIYDTAEVIDSTQFLQIRNLLEMYSLDTKAEILIYTIDKLPSNKSGFEYSQELSERLGLGMKGVNNGVLIFFSLQDRDIEICLGYGFEWIVNHSDLDTMMQKMKFSFRNAKFGDGFLDAISYLIKNTEMHHWEVKQYNERAQVSDVVELKEFTYVTKNDSMIFLKAANGDNLNIKYRNSMRKMLTSLEDRRKKCSVYYRVTKEDTIVLQLLGVVYKNLVN